MKHTPQSKTIKNLYKWHKRLGLSLALFVIMWGLSGIAHPIMSRIKPMVSAQVPLATMDVQHLTGVSQLLPTLDSSQQMLVLALDKHNPVLATQEDEKKSSLKWLYFDAKTGQKIENFNQYYIEPLASLYAGMPSSDIKEINLIDKFDDDYPMVNRYLPAYKISFNDLANTNVYLDAQTLQLASFSNKYKAFFTRWFSRLHSWRFIENPTLRYSLMLITLLIFMASALLGLSMLKQKWRNGQLNRGNKSRRTHRYLGLTVSLAALAFSFSGAFHASFKLLNSLNTPSQELSEDKQKNKRLSAHSNELVWQQFLQSNLKQTNSSNTINRIQFINIDNKSTLQLFNLQQGKRGPKVASIDYYSPNLGSSKTIESQLINHFKSTLAASLTKDLMVKSQLQTHYNHEYGFIDKILPVYRLATEQNKYFFNPNTLSLVKQHSFSTQLESWSFSYLHKARFLDGLGNNWRDIIIVIFVLGIIALVCFGIYTSFKKSNNN